MESRHRLLGSEFQARPSRGRLLRPLVWALLIFLAATARTPSAVISKLNRDMMSALADTTVVQQLEAQGLLAAPSSAEKFSQTIRDDYTKWKNVFPAK